MNLLIVLIVLSVAFPAVSFGLTTGETSAFPLILSLIYCCYFSLNKKAILIAFAPLAFLSVVSCVYLLLVYGGALAGSFVPAPTALKTLVSYLQIAFVFAFFSSIKLTSSVKSLMVVTSRFSVYIHLLIGSLQFFNLAGFIQPLFSVFISRFHSIQLSSGARGVAFLTNEPSHSLWGILFCLFILILMGAKSDIITAWIAFLITLVLSKSVVLIAFFIAFLFCIILRILLKGATKIVVNQSLSRKDIVRMLFLLSFLFAARSFAAPYFSRFFEILNTSITSLVDTIILASGFRLPMLLATLSHLLDFSFDIPLMFGAWYVKSLALLDISGFDIYSLGHFKYNSAITPIRPPGFFLNLIIDFWWIGFLVYAILFITAGTSLRLANFLHVNKSSSRGPFLALFVSFFLFRQFFVPFGFSSFEAVLALVLFNRNGLVASCFVKEDLPSSQLKSADNLGVL
jgi:hypothetical protein